MTTILIIEDDRDIRDFMLIILKMGDYTVLTAKNGQEGIQVAIENQPDLIICDIMIPLLNGYEVFKRLHDADIVPPASFIFASALDKGPDVRRGLMLGADDYLAKPFARHELLEVVEGVLSRRALVESVEEPAAIPNDIFLSYAHDDREYMHDLREALEKQGFRVWCDEEIEPARDWAQALAEMITHSHCVVSILSPNAAQSKWVGRELGYAETNDTRIFPILVHGTPKGSIPLRLINHQFVDARDTFDDAVSRLSQAIKEHLATNV